MTSTRVLQNASPCHEEQFSGLHTYLQVGNYSLLTCDMTPGLKWFSQQLCLRF